jgi:hypothetical protein
MIYYPLPFCSEVPLLDERDVGRGLIGRMFYDLKYIYCLKNIFFLFIPFLFLSIIPFYLSCRRA